MAVNTDDVRSVALTVAPEIGRHGSCTASGLKIRFTQALATLALKLLRPLGAHAQNRTT